jgi:hypothetical protein
MTVTVGRWKVSLLQDHENGTANVVAAVTGSWEVKESELLLLNHEKCEGREYGTVVLS